IGAAAQLFDEHRLPALQFDIGQLIRRSVAKCLRWKAQTEGVRSPPALSTSSAAFVFPVRLVHKHDIHPPNDDRLASFDPARRIDEVAPDDVPPRMVVVRLNGPRTRAALRFKCEFRRWLEASAQRQVGESLLRYVGMLVAFVRTECVECSYAKNPDDAAEDVG